MRNSDEDLFDFSEQISGNKVTSETQHSELNTPKKSETNTSKIPPLTTQNEITTAYLLANALTNLLVEKGIISRSELQRALSDLNFQYIARKKEED